MESKNCVIVGNGPSLAAIDYARLPKDFDVFRCNQFYFEDKYYLGKEVKLAFAIPNVLFEQTYTLQTLRYRGEYKIQDIVVSTFNMKHMDYMYLARKELFQSVIDGHSYLVKLRDFNEFMHYNEIFLDRRITSGIYMCAVAVALGYEEIYLTGLDLYEGSKLYGFDFLQENIVRLVPRFGGEGRPNVFHSKEIDLEALDLLTRLYGAKFFCISPSSPLCNYVPLAKNQGFHENWILESKSEGYIKDILIPSQEAYEKFDSRVSEDLKVCRAKSISNLDEEECDEAIERLDDDRFYAAREAYKSELKNNLLYRLLKDIFRFPKHLAQYIRGKFLLAKWKRD